MRPRSFGADEHAARPLEDMPELLARQTDGGRIDDRRHLVGMVDQDAKEQRLVAVMQRSQIDVLLQVRGFAAEILQHTLDLLFLRKNSRRQQTPQAQRIALGFGERRALVGHGILQQRHAR